MVKQEQNFSVKINLYFWFFQSFFWLYSLVVTGCTDGIGKAYTYEVSYGEYPVYHD